MERERQRMTKERKAVQIAETRTTFHYEKEFIENDRKELKKELQAIKGDRRPLM